MVRDEDNLGTISVKKTWERHTRCKGQSLQKNDESTPASMSRPCNISRLKKSFKREREKEPNLAKVRRLEGGTVEKCGWVLGGILFPGRGGDPKRGAKSKKKVFGKEGEEGGEDSASAAKVQCFRSSPQSRKKEDLYGKPGRGDKPLKKRQENSQGDSLEKSEKMRCWVGLRNKIKSLELGA